jgi:hypothetical protein
VKKLVIENVEASELPARIVGVLGDLVIGEIAVPTLPVSDATVLH